MSQGSGSKVTEPSNSTRTGVAIARAIAFALAYVAAGVAGLHFATIGETVSLVWPPTGLAIAAVFLWGRPMALAVAVGAFLVNYPVSHSIPVATTIGLGNALEAVLGAWLLGRFGVAGGFHRRRDVVGLGATAALAPLLAAAVGTLALVASGIVVPAAAPRTALQWWAGDAAGAILLVPLLLSASVAGSALRWLPIAATSAATAATAAFVFVVLPQGDATLALAILPYGFLLWSALRYEALGASATAFTLSTVVALCTAAGLGPFAIGSPSTALWSQWLFIAVTGTFALVITALNSERVASERAHVKLERRFRNAFESAPTGMAILAADHSILAANATFCHLIGTSDPIGSTLARWTDDAGWARLSALDGPSTGPALEARSTSVTFRSETGAERHCVVRSTWLGGSASSRLLHVEDVTPARLAERERQRLVEQLVHSQRMDGIGQLAGGIAHDLNNILQAVNGNLDLIAASQGAPPRLEWITGARHAAARASALTRQLLTFSRRAPMVAEVVDLGEVVRASAGMLSRLLPDGTRLDVEAGEGLFVLGDAAQLEQVLLNLVVNARDAMSEGRIVLVAWRAPGSDRIEMFVEDEGPGIEPALRERVFEPFFTTKEPGRGTGLGLAVAYGIAHAHGGRIWAEEGSQGGARIVLSLPASEPPRAAPISLPTVARDDFAARRTVLVAEDDPDVLEVAEQFLAAEGYEVLTARDGIEAIERFRAVRGQVDAVVFDVVMPRLSGAEALRAIVEEAGPLPAVLVSGYVRDLADPLVLKDLGVEFLSKPYSQAQLVAAIGRAMSHADATPRRALSR